MTDTRCPWCLNDPLYIRYHDEEWGQPCHDDQKLFEFLILEGAQAGLNWLTVLKKREGYREAFCQFDPHKVATLGQDDIERLMANPAIIRNRLKIKSAINNAKAFIKIQDKFGSFDQFLWQFVDGQPIKNNWHSLSEVPATTKESILLSQALKKEGFTFVGSTICYAYMQAMGLVNDHLINCPLFTIPDV